MSDTAIKITSGGEPGCPTEGQKNVTWQKFRGWMIYVHREGSWWEAGVEEAGVKRKGIQ